MFNYIEIGNRINQRRKKLGLTLADVAADVGVAASTVQRYEKGDFGRVKMPVVKAIARALKASPEWLLGYTDDPYDYELDPDGRFSRIPTAQFERFKKLHGDDLKAIWESWQKIEPSAQNRILPSNAIPYTPSSAYAPILGAIPAGYPVLADENIEGYASVDYPEPNNYFWLRVKGDSMINAGIDTGDLVLIRWQSCANDGQIVACRVNGDEATLKRYRKQEGSVVLVPENPKYPPQVVKATEFEEGNASVLGVVVEIRKFVAG